MSATSTTERPATAERVEETTGGALVKSESQVERFTHVPVIDRIHERQLKLVQSTIGVKATPAQIGWFLELCAHYDLDWAAREAWLAVPEGRDGAASDRVLIIVGRDGLRKIVNRNHLFMDGDVIRANDTFAIKRRREGMRVVRDIVHEYGHPKDRGDIVASWAEVWNAKGEQVGFFVAPLDEYKPENPHSRSVWSKQVSVMILAAAERQAARQATPLGGLLVEGEDESIAGTAVEIPAVDDLPESVRGLIARAREVGHAALSNPDTVAVQLGGQPESAVEQFVARAHGELDRYEALQREAAQRAEAPAEPQAPGEGAREAMAPETQQPTPTDDRSGDAEVLAPEERGGPQPERAPTEHGTPEEHGEPQPDDVLDDGTPIVEADVVDETGGAAAEAPQNGAEDADGFYDSALQQPEPPSDVEQAVPGPAAEPTERVDALALAQQAQEARTRLEEARSKNDDAAAHAATADLQRISEQLEALDD